MSLKNYPNFKKYLNKNILSVDYGTKVTGLASFCPGREPFPTPFSKITTNSDEQKIQELLKIVQNEAFDLVVLGMPFYLDGKKSQMTQRVEKFAEQLEKLLPKGIPLIHQDETLSSFEAEDRMKKSPRYNYKVNAKEIDALAATIILEDFIKCS